MEFLDMGKGSVPASAGESKKVKRSKAQAWRKTRRPGPNSGIVAVRMSTTDAGNAINLCAAMRAAGIRAEDTTISDAIRAAVAYATHDLDGFMEIARRVSK